MNPSQHDDEIWELADLRYSQDSEAGYTRVRRGRGFSYHATNGVRLRSARSLKRIQALVIPPVWTGVWICTDAHGHLQVTGFDERGRKQYLYHPRWRE